MNTKYPEYILCKVRESKGLEKEDTSKDEKFNTLSPEEVWACCLNWEGIIGYEGTLNTWHDDIFGKPVGPTKTRKSFIEAFGKFISHFPEVYTADVISINYKDTGDGEFAVIHYEGGGTRRVNICMDSYIAAMRDILKQID